MSEPSVFKFASVVVWVLLIGSRITLPNPPVARSTKFGTFPAAIRSPSRSPEIDSPLMSRAAQNDEATVVSSLIVTLSGNFVPSSVIRAIASLGPLPEPALGVPPLAITYSMLSPGTLLTFNLKAPATSVLPWANWTGLSLLAE